MAAASPNLASASPMVKAMFQTYGVLLSDAGLARCLENLPPADHQNTKAVFQQLTQLNLGGGDDEERALTLPGGLQRDIGSQPALKVAQPTFVQIEGSRDVTQPLRLCSDSTADVDDLWGASQNLNLKTRLLKLILTDGHVSVPAIELATLKTFKSIPIPGEKLIVKDFEVKNGMIILTDEAITYYGGGVEKLRNEFFLLRDRRNRGAGYKAAELEGAPKFEQFHASAGFESKVKAIDAAAGRPLPGKRSHEAQPTSGGHRGNNPADHHPRSHPTHEHSEHEGHGRGHGRGDGHHREHRGRGRGQGHGHGSQHGGGHHGRGQGGRGGRGHHHHHDPSTSHHHEAPSKAPNLTNYEEDWPELN